MIILSELSFAGAGNAQEILNANLNIEIKDATLKEALTQIEKLAHVKFAYSKESVESAKLISLKAINEKLSDILDKLLDPQGLDYEIISGRIVLKKRQKTLLLPIPTREFKVTGKVLGDDSEVLPGVSVVLKGTVTGTVTDIEGNYSLTVPDNQGTLIFSFIGYTTQEQPINNRSVIDVKLMTDIKSLQEVVVVGYGTQTKKELTGSIARVDGKDINSATVPSFEAALQGKAAGVQVIQGSGLAGSGSMIRVRGIASLSAGGDPLYVVDGIPITQDYFTNGDRGAFNSNPLSTINPNDIESVDILKDASAAAIYGSRGANGVILITTKRGKSGKPKFEFSTKFGISNPTRKIDLLNSKEWLQLNQEAWENDGGVGPASLPGGVTYEQALNTDTDWLDLTTQTGVKQEYNLSVSQGNSKLKTYAGFSYSNNQSFLVGNSYERISGRINVDYQLLSNLKASLSSSLSRGLNNRVASAWDGGYGSAMSDALPIYPVRNSDGTYFRPQDASNPMIKQDLLDWKTREIRTINNLSLDYTPIKNLNVRLTGGLDYMDNEDNKYEPGGADRLNTDPTVGRGKAEWYPTWTTNYTAGLVVSYDLNLNKAHKFNLLGGTEYQHSLTSKYDRVEAFDVTGPINEIDEYPDRVDNEGKPLPNPQYTTGPDQLWSFISYFGRLNYSYKEKYIFKGSARVDGSSRFGRNNRYGFFPSLGLGYIISEEDFFPENNIVNFLKFKASWGITGNADIPNYQRWATFQRRTAEGGSTYNQEPILYPVRLENPNLK